MALLGLALVLVLAVLRAGLLLIERHTVAFGLAVLKLAWLRWDWGVLFSPSAAFCWGVIAFSVFFPLYGLGTIGSLVAARQQWRWIHLLAVAILWSPFVTDPLIWGSFPLTYDNAGVAIEAHSFHSVAERESLRILIEVWSASLQQDRVE